MESESNMQQALKVLRADLEQRKGRLVQLHQQLQKAEGIRKGAKRALWASERAQALIQQVAQTTQQELEYRISELVTLALSSVFPDPYQFKLRFVVRRGKTEADLLFLHGDQEIDPLSASGGGVVDVAAFALRVALWRLSNGLRPVLVLDEPFRFVSSSYLPAAGEMLRSLSEKMGLQIVMVTHLDALVEIADRVFQVRKLTGASVVEVA